MKLLVNNGADVNVHDNNGRTPLHLAIASNFVKGRHEIDNYCNFLISNGADREIKDKNGETYFCYLFSVHKNYR